MKKLFLTSVFSAIALICFSQVPENGKPQLATAEKKDTVSNSSNGQTPVLGNGAPAVNDGKESQKGEHPVSPAVLSESSDPKRKK